MSEMYLGDNGGSEERIRGDRGRGRMSQLETEKLRI